MMVMSHDVAIRETQINVFRVREFKFYLYSGLEKVGKNNSALSSVHVQIVESGVMAPYMEWGL
jgi:hypothetical protein